MLTPAMVMVQSPLDAFPADPDCFEEGSYCDRRLERAALAEAVEQYAQKVAPGTEGPRECGNMYAGAAMSQPHSAHVGNAPAPPPTATYGRMCRPLTQQQVVCFQAVFHWEFATFHF